MFDMSEVFIAFLCNLSNDISWLTITRALNDFLLLFFFQIKLLNFTLQN